MRGSRAKKNKQTKKKKTKKSKKANPVCTAVFSAIPAVHACRYNMDVVTVLRYLKCTNSAIYFL